MMVHNHCKVGLYCEMGRGSTQAPAGQAQEDRAGLILPHRCSLRPLMPAPNLRSLHELRMLHTDLQGQAPPRVPGFHQNQCIGLLKV